MKITLHIYNNLCIVYNRFRPSGDIMMGLNLKHFFVKTVFSFNLQYFTEMWSSGTTVGLGNCQI